MPRTQIAIKKIAHDVADEASYDVHVLLGKLIVFQVFKVLESLSTRFLRSRLGLEMGAR